MRCLAEIVRRKHTTEYYKGGHVEHADDEVGNSVI